MSQLDRLALARDEVEPAPADVAARVEAEDAVGQEVAIEDVAEQPAAVTGYNIYRSEDPAVPSGSWPLVASNIVDMDEGTPNWQWIDASGDVSPSGIWYYEVYAYSAACGVEGP